MKNPIYLYLLAAVSCSPAQHKKTDEAASSNNQQTDSLSQSSGNLGVDCHTLNMIVSKLENSKVYSILSVVLAPYVLECASSGVSGVGTDPRREDPSLTADNAMSNGKGEPKN